MKGKLEVFCAILEEVHNVTFDVKPDKSKGQDSSFFVVIVVVTEVGCDNNNTTISTTTSQGNLQECLRHNIDKYANETLNTLNIARCVRELLSVHNIGQRLFAKFVLSCLRHSQ
ncbi:hypothetical protein CEXT_547201 [Caerostris extrusa]|uniref:CUT domain-containing protein n=1 Tax=Caerostris extrusa TaxID=172846 RepID=A0AAV4VHN9_CAEEX|nr:hypothetical protein CEXT_547201 [Caerostris extrusa]